MRTVRLAPRTAGLAAVGCALVVAAANLLLPWYAVRATDGLHLVFRADVAAQGGILYEKELLWLPLAASACAALAGLWLWLAPRQGRRRAWALGLLAAAGAALLLCATRWLGFYAARLLDPGPTLVHLHVVPYLDALAGALLVAGPVALWGPLRPGQARPLWAATAAMGGLVLLPLLPLAVKRPEGFHYDELTMELARVVGAPGARAATDLAEARFLLAGLAAVAAVVALLPAPRVVLASLRVLAGVAGAAVAGLAMLFYLDVGGLADGVSPWPTPFLPFAGLGLLAVTAWPMRKPVLPGKIPD